MVNAVQEEIGLRGAEMIARRIKPDAAIVTDVTHDSTTPMVSKFIEGDISCGKGPSLCYGPAVHNRLLDLVQDVEELVEVGALQRAGDEMLQRIAHRTGLRMARVEEHEHQVRQVDDVIRDDEGGAALLVGIEARGVDDDLSAELLRTAGLELQVRVHTAAFPLRHLLDVVAARRQGRRDGQPPMLNALRADQCVGDLADKTWEAKYDRNPDADPADLRRELPPVDQDLPASLLHGPAAALRLTGQSRVVR